MMRRGTTVAAGTAAAAAAEAASSSSAIVPAKIMNLKASSQPTSSSNEPSSSSQTTTVEKMDVTPDANNGAGASLSVTTSNNDDGDGTNAVQNRRISKSNAALVDALAGACAGAFAKTAVAPIERVKLLLQLQGSIEPERAAGTITTATIKGGGSSSGGGAGAGGGAGGGGAVMIGGRNAAQARQSAWQVARSVYREQGILAFWRGNTPNVIRQGGTAAMNFMLMDWYKRAISPILAYTLNLPSTRPHIERKKRRALFSSFLSGGLAGGTTTTVLYPIEFLRTRLAMDMGATKETRKYPRGMRDVFCQTWKSDGVRGLYQGYGIALAGVVLYRASHLGGYDAVKTEIVHRRRYHNIDSKGQRGGEFKEATLTMGERFVAAQIVSIVAGTMCYPIDSVRRRLMMQAGLSLEQRLYRNSIDCFRKVFATEGFRGFYLGIGPNIVRSFGGALLLVGYDIFKGMIY